MLLIRVDLMLRLQRKPTSSTLPGDPPIAKGQPPAAERRRRHVMRSTDKSGILGLEWEPGVLYRVVGRGRHRDGGPGRASHQRLGGSSACPGVERHIYTRPACRADIDDRTIH